jgi:Fur family ferric uptake transcriptional regulator
MKRMTVQRQVILEELRNSGRHPTADQLYQLVRRRLLRISLGTVYRNLDLLSGSGVIRKLESGNARTRFDADMTEHNHIRCLECGCVADVAKLVSVESGEEIQQMTGFTVTGYHLEFLGICPECGGSEERRPAQDD